MPRHNLQVFLLGSVLLFITGRALSATPALEGWPIFRHDSGHSGYNADVGSFRPPLAHMDSTLLENPHPETVVISSVLTGPERAYILGHRRFWGTNKTDPSIQWRNDDCVQNMTTGSLCANIFMAYVSDKLVVMRLNTFYDTFDFGYQLLVYDAATGMEEWAEHLGDFFPLIVVDGEAILSLTFDGVNGTLTKRDLAGGVDYTVSADYDGFDIGSAVAAGGLIIYPNDDMVLAYQVSNGQFAWDYTPPLQADPHGYDLTATADAVIISQNDRVIKLNLAGGGYQWATPVKPPGCTSELGPNGAATDGNIIVISAVCDQEVVGLDYAGGGELWRQPIGGNFASGIAMGGSELYAASITANPVDPTDDIFHLFAFDPVTGNELEHLELSTNDPDFDYPKALVISDGLLLMASWFNNRTLMRFERTPADLSAQLIGVSSGQCSPSVGGTVTFTFLVTNLGEGTTDTADVVLTNLPPGALMLSASQGTCNPNATPDPTCNLGPLGVGDQVELTATIELSMDGMFMPEIFVEGNVRDPEETNNTYIYPDPFNVNPAPPMNLDLFVTGMEITQGIQNLNNDVHLAISKKTMVRVYAQTNAGSVDEVSAVLHGQIPMGEFLGTRAPIPGGSCMTVDSDTPNRDLREESFVFELPDEWLVQPLQLTAEINPSGAIPEIDQGNNTWMEEVEFLQLAPICLMTYPVRSTGTPVGGGGIIFDLAPDKYFLASDDGNVLSRALTMLPTANIKVFPNSHLLEEWEFFDFEYGPYEFAPESENDMTWVIVKLWIRNTFTDDPDECDEAGNPAHYVGMIDEGTIIAGVDGKAVTPGDELTAVLFSTATSGPGIDRPVGGAILAHELGHNYGREHVDCGGPEDPDENYPDDRNRCNFAAIDPSGYYGLDFIDATNPVVVRQSVDMSGAAMAGDLMSYAARKWSSEYTWNAIQDGLCKFPVCILPSQAETPAGTEGPPPSLEGEVLLIWGQIVPQMTILESYVLNVDHVPKAAAIWAEQIATRPETAVYTLNLMNGVDLLYSEPFTPKSITTLGSVDEFFGLIIPWDPATTHIELHEEDTITTSLAVSPSPPEVTSIDPDGGEVIVGDELSISWTATDADGDELLYTVLYSCNGGSSWRALDAGTGGTQLTVDSSLLPGGDGQCLIKIIASDGLNSGVRQSASGFTMPNRLPEAFIHFPDDGATYPPDYSMTARGAVFDPEDEYLLAENLSWELSGYGILGSGESIALPELPEGQFTLTLSGEDSQGQPASTEIAFTIGIQPEFDSDPVPGVSLDFGDQVQLTESELLAVHVSNLGTADLSLTCAITGPNAASFNLIDCPTPIEGGNFVSVSVTCQPASLGAKIATLELMTNDTDETTPTFELICTGIEGTAGDLIFQDGFEG